MMWVYDVLTKPEYGYNWDGKPAYVPEWAKKIWTDEATRPTGWRALVFYSGEILKLDYPVKPKDPNVRPMIKSTILAAAIAGYKLRLDSMGKFETPRLEYADLRAGSESQMIVRASLLKNNDFVSIEPYENESLADRGGVWVVNYADWISHDYSRFAQTLIFLAITTHCIRTPQFEHLEGTC